MKTNFLFWTAIVAVFAAVSCNDNSDEGLAVRQGVLAVRLDQNKIELVKGQSFQLNAQVVPAHDVEFTWSSQDAEYVTVDQNGLVTAVGLKKEEGSDEVKPVSVYAQYLNGADECKVTVLPLEPQRVEIVYSSNVLKLDPGAAASVQLQAKVYPEDADIVDLTWTTNYASFATVDQTGRVTGVAPGFATIRAAYNDKVYDEIDVQVNLVNPTAVAINPSDLSLEVGQKARLKVVFTPENASGSATWTSDAPTIVDVDHKTGAIEAMSAGTANIKVQVGSLEANCEVIVK